MLAASDIGVLDEVLSLAKEAAARKASGKKAPDFIKQPEKSNELKSLQKQELKIWHHWNNTGRKAKDLKPLLDSYKPLIQRTASKWVSRVEVPDSAIHAELRKQFVNAVKSYDPGKGAQLSSWITTHLQKASRFVKTYQNFGKIPEGNIAKIKELQTAKMDLLDKLGYEPDTKTIADHLKWPQKRVIQMIKENRKDMPASGYEHDPTEMLTPKELEAVHLLQFDTRLGPEERSVYEYVFGINGKPRLAPGEIAKKTGIHPSKVSRIRTKLKTHIQEAIEVL